MVSIAHLMYGVAGQHLLIYPLLCSLRSASLLQLYPCYPVLAHRVSYLRMYHHQKDMKKARINHHGVPRCEWSASKSNNENFLSFKSNARASELKRLRHWQTTNYGRSFYANPRENNGHVFTLVSYNVLAQWLLMQNRYLYDHCHRKSLDWNLRKNSILAEIAEYLPDILCLQEVQDEHYSNFYQPELDKLGYCGTFKKRTGPDKKDGCALFYRTEAFALESIAEVEFRKSDVPILDRDNVGLVALLKPTNPSVKSKLCVATTHLLFNPKRGDIKLAQLSMLLAEVDRIARRPKRSGDGHRYPVVLCGDFNSEPRSPLYDFISTRELNYDNMLSGNVSGQYEGQSKGRRLSLLSQDLSSIGINKNCQYYDVRQSNKDARGVTGNHLNSCDLSHSFNFLSVYKHLIQDDTSVGYSKEVTTYHSLSCTTVDYIFYAVGVERVRPEDDSLGLLSRLTLMTERNIRRMGGLPNDLQASDHLMLGAKFVLN